MDFSEYDIKLMVESIPYGHDTSTEIWKRGALYSIEKDKEKIKARKDTKTEASELRGYLIKTVESDASRNVGFKVKPFKQIIEKGVEENILRNEERAHFLFLALRDRFMFKDDMKELLSDEEVRDFAIHEYERNPGNEANEKVYKLVEAFERSEIVRDGSDIGKVSKILGKKIANATKKGIAPRKKDTAKLNHNDAVMNDALRTARGIARNTNPDKLADRQKKIEGLETRFSGRMSNR